MNGQLLLAKALLGTLAFLGFAGSLPQNQRISRLDSLRSKEGKNMTLTRLERAYVDVYRILAVDTQCGKFFGAGSRDVLDQFIVTLRDRTLYDPSIAMRLSGSFTRSVIPKEGTEYRLFERAEINRHGAFYRSRTVFTDGFVPGVGSFHSDTREARVLILLHELAHLIKGANGAWLIPDDGKNEQLSRINNKTVESQCGEQIRGL